MKKGTGIMCVSSEKLISALGLPPDTEISDCRMAFYDVGIIELKIQHETLPDVSDGLIIQHVSAIFDDDGFVEFK